MAQHLNRSSVKHIQDFINHFFYEMLLQLQGGIWVKWNHLVLEPSFWGKISISKSWTIFSNPFLCCDIKLFKCRTKVVSNKSHVERCRPSEVLRRGLGAKEEHPFFSAKLNPMEREEEENNTLDFLSSIYFFIFFPC